MNDPNEILEPALDEAKRVLEEMKKTKDLEARKCQSEILRNLCQSAGVFFELMTAAMGAEDLAPFLEDEEDDDEDGLPW